MACTRDVRSRCARLARTHFSVVPRMAAFTLTPEHRARLRPSVDPVALELFLQRAPESLASLCLAACFRDPTLEDLPRVLRHDGAVGSIDVGVEIEDIELRALWGRVIGRG